MSRRKGPVETPEYGAMVRRMLRAYAVRVGDADPEDLADLAELRDEVEAAIATAVTIMRSRWDRPWSEIGKGLDITRQAAQQRYGRPMVTGRQEAS